jgi:hypothetical protein
MADRRDIRGEDVAPRGVWEAVVMIDIADLFVRSTAFLASVGLYVRSPMVSPDPFSPG